MSAHPAIIGRYTVLRRLGAGAMGEVYLARDPSLDRTVAIKLLLYEEREDLRRRFFVEARSAGTLNHPNIVTIHDLGEHEGRPYLVMEYVFGQTLAALIDRQSNRDSTSEATVVGPPILGPLSLPRRLRFIEELCAGLGAAHRAGIVHRDVKPANLMIDQRDERRPTLKILDFGIARVMDASALRMTKGPLGTPRYMAPEQYLANDYDFRADIFSAGAVMYELLTYAPAFHGATYAQILWAVCHLEPVPLGEAGADLGEAGPALEAIVRRALAKEADYRYQSIEEMREDIEQVRLNVASAPTPVPPRPLEVHPPSAPTEAALPTEVSQPSEALVAGTPAAERAALGKVHRRFALPKWLTAGAIAVVLFGAVLGVWQVVRSGPPPPEVAAGGEAGSGGLKAGARPQQADATGRPDTQGDTAAKQQQAPAKPTADDASRSAVASPPKTAADAVRTAANDEQRRPSVGPSSAPAPPASTTPGVTAPGPSPIVSSKPTRAAAPAAKTASIDVPRTLAAAEEAFGAGEYGRALAAVNGVLKVDPGSLPARTLRDRVASAQGAEVRRLVRAAENSFNGGDYDAAIATLGKALAVEPGSVAAAELLTKVRSAKAAEERRRREPSASHQGARFRYEFDAA